MQKLPVRQSSCIFLSTQSREMEMGSNLSSPTRPGSAFSIGGSPFQKAAAGKSGSAHRGPNHGAETRAPQREEN
jgi:hypothetical protein